MDETPGVTLHENEIPVDETLVRFLLKAQCPEWADLPLSSAGTDNTMYRLGDDLWCAFRATTGSPSGRSSGPAWRPTFPARSPTRVRRN